MTKYFFLFLCFSIFLNSCTHYISNFSVSQNVSYDSVQELLKTYNLPKLSNQWDSSIFIDYETKSKSISYYCIKNISKKEEIIYLIHSKDSTYDFEIRKLQIPDL